MFTAIGGGVCGMTNGSGLVTETSSGFATELASGCVALEATFTDFGCGSFASLLPLDLVPTNIATAMNVSNAPASTTKREWTKLLRLGEFLWERSIAILPPSPRGG